MRVQVHIRFDTGTSAAFVTWNLPVLTNIATVDNLHTQDYLGHKGFQLSPSRDKVVSSLDGTYMFYSSDGYRGILTREISNASGVFENPPEVTFKLRGSNLRNLYVIFDRACGEYAKHIRFSIDDSSWDIYNDNVFMDIPITNYATLDSATTYMVGIEVLEWSKPFASAKIAQITCDFSDVFTGSTITELECSENALDSQVLVKPGIVEQFADISLYDRYKRLHTAAAKDILLSNATVNISAVGIEGVSYSLGSYIADKWDINATDLYVKLSCSDPSRSFDKIRIEHVPVKERSVDEMLQLLFSYVGNYAWRYIDSDTAEYCKSIVTPNNWFKTDTLDNLLNKVCALGMIRIYWSNNAFVVMRCW